ncbi:MAG TPA: prenyltransferase/squalene oxidase repeat-containing protein [Pirellulales bacterium]|nr:prenyltransferase/squalene oxidase repeat-containing protein [Pirellulales bacterium]
MQDSVLSRVVVRFVLMLAAGVCWQGVASARAADDKDTKELGRIVSKGIDYLRQKGQAEDGSFTKQVGPGITSLVTTAVIRNGRSTRDPLVTKGLKYLEKFVQPNGGIYAPNSRLPNYETCLSIVCFKEANDDGRYDQLIKKADAYIKGLQKDSDEGKDESDVAYGGAGYGEKGRPDLSNTHFLIEALRAAGNDADDEALKKALVFVSRCQNLESEHNATPFPAKNPDGGFYYTPTGEGASPAGKTDNGGLRSYGAMTYAGLKSMVFAGVGPDDPRVKAAVDWARKHYTLEENPGLGSAGLYYYYHLFAKALDAIGTDEFVDSDGVEHNWRHELIEELGRRQQPDGSWVNTDDRWLEGDRNLCTGFALLALSYCRPAEKK